MLIQYQRSHACCTLTDLFVFPLPRYRVPLHYQLITFSSLQEMVLQRNRLLAANLAKTCRQREGECASLVLFMRALAAQHVLDNQERFWIGMQFDYTKYR